MNHVWSYEEWKDLPIGEVYDSLMEWQTGQNLKSMGNMTVSEMCCLATKGKSPVGLYIFIENDQIRYVGKTHGRSFQERMLSHIDNRTPVPGSPHLAQFVQSLVKRRGIPAEEAVDSVLGMKVVWMPIPNMGKGNDFQKSLIAAIERRLLWHRCLDPDYNSPRVKRNDYFTMKGLKYILSESETIGDCNLQVAK